MKRSLIPLGLAVTLVGLLSVARAEEIPISPPTESFPATVAVAWFDLLYDVVKAEHVTPPQAARIYGLAAVALYEAIAPGSFTHRSLVGQLNELVAVPQPERFRRHHWPTVANSALSSMIRTLFPAASQASLEAIMALERAFATAFQDGVRPSVYARSVSHGQAVAEAISAWAATDGLSTLNDCAYTPPVGRPLGTHAPRFRGRATAALLGAITPHGIAIERSLLPASAPSLRRRPGIGVLYAGLHGLSYRPDAHRRAADHRALLGG